MDENETKKYTFKSLALRKSISLSFHSNVFHHQATRPISELRYLSDIDLTINSFDHQKDSPIIHRHSKRLEFVADNQDGRGWMEKKKREKNETRKEKDTNNIRRMEREIRCVLSLSLGFSFSSPPHASSPASSPFNASFPFLTIFSSSHFPDHWRRFIDAVSRGGENS